MYVDVNKNPHRRYSSAIKKKLNNQLANIVR
jgi:hypothetical protein